MVTLTDLDLGQRGKISSLVKQGLCNGVLTLSQPAHRDVAGRAFGSGIGSEGGENGLEMVEDDLVGDRATGDSRLAGEGASWRCV
jgi:hypothetical protein